MSLPKKVEEIAVSKGKELTKVDLPRNADLKEVNLFIDVDITNNTAGAVTYSNESFLGKIFDLCRVERNGRKVYSRRDLVSTRLKAEYEQGNLYTSIPVGGLTVGIGATENVKISVPMNFALNEFNRLNKLCGIQKNANSLELRINTLSPTDIAIDGKIIINVIEANENIALPRGYKGLLINSEISEVKALNSSIVRYDVPTGSLVRNFAFFMNNDFVAITDRVKKINLWVNSDLIAQYDYESILSDTKKKMKATTLPDGYLVLDFDNANNGTGLLDLTNVSNGDAKIEFECDAGTLVAGDQVIINTEKIEPLMEI